MNLKIMLPAVKYKDIPAGRMFVFSDCIKLFATTNSHLPVNGEFYQNLKEPVCLNRPNEDKDVFDMFQANSLREVAEKDCYLVATEGKITEIKY